MHPDPLAPSPTLGNRLAAAGATAEHETELGIARVRAWCLVFALVQTALRPGQFWYLAWGAMALLVLNTIWVRRSLRGSGGIPVHVVGIVAMAADTLAVVMVMANLMANPDDPIQLLPLALAVEAGVRWARLGGIVGGVGGGLLLTGWSLGSHARNGLDLSVGYAGFRCLVVVLIGTIVGSGVQDLRQHRRAAEAVFQASRDLMATFRLDGTPLAVNPAGEELLGYAAAELLARAPGFLLGDEGVLGGHLVVPDGPRRVLRQLQHRDGRHLWIELDLVPDPQAGLVYAIGRDVSDRSRAESELRHRVDHDGLTGAWNRHALVAYLHRMLSRGYRPALIFVDLDGFKDVNDQHGHLVGDAVIRQLAERLAEAAGHEGSVARYAGDEFCVVVDDPDDLDAVAERIDLALAPPFRAEGRELTVTASLGLAHSRAGDNPDALVHRADLAMYEAKRATRLPL
jgi:diguanylate cyclase (GGDEF)-like protein/PAS domain S-box-containing protein